MRTRVAVGLVVVAAAGGFGLFGPGRPAAGGDKPAAAAADHDFGTKVLLLSTRATPDRPKGGSMVIEKVRVRRLGDQHFLSGRGSAVEGGEWAAGATVWIALTDVDMIVEYDTVEAVRKSFKDRNKQID